MKRSKLTSDWDDLQTPLFSRNGDEGKPVLITGGAGFIGTNVAARFLSAGKSVIIYDNISRPGVERNIKWLRETFGARLQVEVADMRDAANLRYTVKNASRIFHFAAQVAVTTSLTAPIDDFEINARGTLNLLEAIRSLNNPPPLVFTSTNKVYGDLADVKIRDNGCRYEPEEDELRINGISESRSLDFHSPYGCSKGAAEQYVLDYARTFKIPALVFRMSCIYGEHQYGNEDQGWVAHFLIRALHGEPVTIYGDGKQVRDVLFIKDLVNAFLLAHEHMPALSGQAFNIGGGPGNTISLLELLELIRNVDGRKPAVDFAPWRPADQQYYVSDIRKFAHQTGWAPTVSVRDGVKKLYHWLCETRGAAPQHIGRIDGEAIALDEGKQMAVIQSAILQQQHEPRSKRLWQESNNNGVLTRTPRKEARS